MIEKHKDFHNAGRNKSFSINIDKNNINNYNNNLKNKDKEMNIANLKYKYKYQSHLLSSPKKPRLIESKSQTNILTKSIKVSFNKYHQYINSLKNYKNLGEKRPISLHFNNKNKDINNREEIENVHSAISKNKNFYSKKIKSFFSGNNNNNLNPNKINQLNLGIHSQSTKNSSFMNNFDETSLFNKIKNNKNIATLSFKKLKNSKFFYKTKYVNGTKNKNIKNSKLSSLSTYNISFPKSNELIYNTINEMIKKKLLNTENEESIHINKLSSNNIKKSEDDEIKKAKYFDLLPVILNHLKQKQMMDDIYGEYNQYLSNISKSTVNNINNKNEKEKEKQKENTKKYPRIKYLFLENIINNLKHVVKFIDVKNNVELEQNVIKVIKDEYDKLKENNKDFEEIKDFLTYGYEYVPKHMSIYKLPIVEDRGMQISHNSNKHSFFFINEQKMEESQSLINNNNTNVISPKKSFSLKDYYSGNKGIFKKTEYKSRNKDEIIKDFHSIFSSYGSKDDISNENYNDINTILNNENLKKIKSIKDKLNKMNKNQNNNNKNDKIDKTDKKRPKFIKINLKRKKLENIKENFNENNSFIKFDLLKKNNEAGLLLSPEKDEKNYNIKKKDNENKNNQFEDNKDNNINYEQKEELNDINSINKSISENQIINPEVNLLDEKKKINNNNLNPDNTENTKSNIDSKSIEIKKDIEQSNDDNKNKEKELEVNKTQKDKSEESEKSVTKRENEIKNIKKTNWRKKEKRKEKLKEKKLYVEELENENNDENDKSAQSSKKLKEESENILLKSIENTLIALEQIEKHAKKKNKKIRAFNELMYHYNNRDINIEYQESDSNKNSQVNKNEDKQELELNKDEEFEEREISVSSLNNSSEELEEFSKLKETFKKKKKNIFEDDTKNIYKRRNALINPDLDFFKEAIKDKEMSELNTKMKKIYDDINKEKKREENKNRKKKGYMFTFASVDPENFDEIEKRKKVNLNILKEDIRYKIIQHKYHLIEMYHYENFSKALMAIDFSKHRYNKKKLRDYIHTMEKYFQLFLNEVINRERQISDEKRINKFLYNMKQEIGEIIPYVTNYKGKFCRSSDLNKEGDLSILNSP